MIILFTNCKSSKIKLYIVIAIAIDKATVIYNKCKLV